MPNVEVVVRADQPIRGIGVEAEVLFASHHWPRWGNAHIQEVLRVHRDLSANPANQSLPLANTGVTIDQIHNVDQVPSTPRQKGDHRGYHGSPENNSRGVLQRFLGYWDGNPTNFPPAPQNGSGALYVEMMGGPDKILATGRELWDQGKY